MSVPVIRRISWLAVVPQLLALGAAIMLARHFQLRDSTLVGGIGYLVYSAGSRKILTSHHRAGIRLVREQRFAEAIEKFQRSLLFFDKHRWIDRYRSIVLMSPSALSYREMALANIAFCYSQIGDGAHARQWYEACLAEFPQSGMAQVGLRIMDAAVAAAKPESPASS
jgi:hypothetical protein